MWTREGLNLWDIWPVIMHLGDCGFGREEDVNMLDYIWVRMESLERPRNRWMSR